MAPKTPDESQDDLSARRRERQARETTKQTPSSPQSDAQPGDRVDFGAFVSNSVRSSADRLKGTTSGTSATRRSKREDAPKATPPTRSERPSRYWRDSLREKTGEDVSVQGTSSRRFLYRGGAPQDGDASYDDTNAGGAGNGGGGGDWRRFLNPGDGDGPNQPILWYFLVGLLLLAILIFLLVRFIGGDDDAADDPDDTPVPTMVIDQDAVSTPTADTDDGQEDADAPTETPGIRRGGDNQRLQPGEDAEGTPTSRLTGEGELALAGTPIAVSPLADECSDRCLVRVRAEDTIEVLAKTGIRPSFLEDEIAWAVITPEQVSYLDVDADLDVIRDDADTQSLYVLKVPSGVDDAMVHNYGAVLDETDDYRLVEFQMIPARVRTLIDWGFMVTKVSPAPPVGDGEGRRTARADDRFAFQAEQASSGNVQQVDAGEKTALSDLQLGLLMGQVSPGNIQRNIKTIQGLGAMDGSALGTRYYSQPGNQIAADYLFQELESYGLNVWYEDFLTPEGILLVNVVAEIPGADESSVYGVMAHFDSINEDDNRLAPGADDNASGLAVNLEIARVLGQYELQHPVRFVFVNAEEVNILGAIAWARQANAENLNVEGVFNIDSVGSPNQGRLIVLNSDGSSDWMQDVLVKVNNDYGLGQEFMRRELSEEIVADDNMVREAGIDAVLIARELYGWSSIHHTSDDVIENVSMENVLSATYLVILAVATLAE